MASRLRARSMRGERGTALVEFALLLPLLALICLGTVDIGRAFSTYNQVKNAAREGAAFAQVYPGRQQAVSGTNCANPNNVVWQARKEAGTASAAFTVAVTPTVAACDSVSTPASGTNVKVTVSTPFSVLTPLVKSVINLNTISAFVTVRVQ